MEKILNIDLIMNDKDKIKIFDSLKDKICVFFSCKTDLIVIKKALGDIYF